MQSDDAPERPSTPDPESILEPAIPERRSLLGRFGGLSDPGGGLSKPTGPIMADPAWVFEERSTSAAGAAEQRPLTDDADAAPTSQLSGHERSDAIAALIAEVEMARVQDARQAAKEPPGETLGGNRHPPDCLGNGSAAGGPSVSMQAANAKTPNGSG